MTTEVLKMIQEMGESANLNCEEMDEVRQIITDANNLTLLFQGLIRSR